MLYFVDDRFACLADAVDQRGFAHVGSSDYRDYRFHAKGFCIGEGLALIVCALAGLIVQFVL